MRKALMAILAVISILLFVACETAETTEKAAPETQETAAEQAAAEDVKEEVKETETAAGKLGFDMLYDYGKIKSYEYKVTTVTDGQTAEMNLKYSISSDSMNGKEAWLQKSEMSTVAGDVVTNMWFDKTNYACLKIKTLINVAGQSIEQESPCPTEGPNSASRTGAETPEVDYVGEESVTVPAGTFSAIKYSAEGATYWVSISVGIPVKVEYGQTKMELVSYS